jgi:hypothetical protein
MAGRVVHIRPDPGGGWQVGDGPEGRTFASEDQAWVEARRLVATGHYAEVRIHGKRGESTSEFHGDLPVDETSAVRSRDALAAQERVDLVRSERIPHPHATPAGSLEPSA